MSTSYRLCVCVCTRVSEHKLKMLECVGWPVLCVVHFDLCPWPDAIQPQWCASAQQERRGAEEIERKHKNERKLASGRGGAAARSGRKRRRESDSELCNVATRQTATSIPIFPIATGCQEGRGGAYTIHENTRSTLSQHNNVPFSLLYLDLPPSRMFVHVVLNQRRTVCLCFIHSSLPLLPAAVRYVALHRLRLQVVYGLKPKRDVQGEE